VKREVLKVATRRIVQPVHNDALHGDPLLDAMKLRFSDYERAIHYD
jgi:hypothetical protein